MTSSLAWTCDAVPGEASRRGAPLRRPASRGPVVQAGRHPALGATLRGLLVGVVAVVAFVVGVAGAVMHRWASPVGLVLAVGAAVGSCVLARYAARSRFGIAGVGLMWLAPVLILAQERPSGDVVIASDAAGLILLFGGAAAVAVTLGMGAQRDREGT